MNQPKTLGILLFPHFETLDVFGPIEMFGLIPEHIEIILIAQQSGLVASAQGQSVLIDYDCDHAPALDLLLIPAVRARGLKFVIKNWCNG